MDEKSSRFIPFAPPLIETEEINEVIDTLKSGWLSFGKKSIEFEELIKNYVKAKHAISVSSCTAALHLSANVIGIQKGDTVITTPFTFVATVNAIIYNGGKPILVDIEKDTYNIDPDKIEEAINENTKAIIAVDYGGHPCDYNHIMDICDEHELYLIEDAAHSLGAEFQNKRVGSFADLTCFSFYPTKNITTGEGGAITTDNNEFAEKLKMLRLHGISKDAWKRYTKEGTWTYDVPVVGYKYNMCDIQASLGIHQIKKINKFLEIRRQLIKIYFEELEPVEQIILPTEKKFAKSAWHLFPIRLNKEKTRLKRDDLVFELKKRMIGTSVHFIPIYKFTAYNHMFNPKKFPITEEVFSTILSLPLSNAHTEEEILYVTKMVKEIIAEYK